MNDLDELFMVCDDRNNIDFDEIDMSQIPPDVLKRLDEAIANVDTEAIPA